MKTYESIIKLYFKSVREFNEFESTPRDFGTGDLLYSSEIHTLQAIGNNSSINLTELADKLDISKSGTSKFVRKLLDKGLITKSKHVGNKKEVVFNLTEKGLVAYLGHEAFSNETFDSIYKVLSCLNENQADFLESFLRNLVLQVEKLNNK
ncbi:MarR family transcriptional regulator [Clostridium sp. 'deep sea']|uniref:MarR family transcriptional regulator n=1 Tax=Clostridium sp. 'deep sea' TaxID=2779445 RepID=UPI0018967EE5|nr:MarR family transcriptional regulator [Clostridium sp. 'deep sea']QOR35191.1 MarR family transcriptional regulator [Clostridium sp. 'deep sea']